MVIGWTDINMFDLEPTFFDSQISEVVMPLFHAADHNLTEWKKQIDADFNEAISKAEHEADETNALGEAAYRESTVGDQRQLIGAACLAFVATAVKDCLGDMARHFNSSHPPGREYFGKSWLQKWQDEYQQRFQIDFTKSPIKVGNIEELILARNAGLHWDGSALEEYRRKVTFPRFIKQGSFTVDHDDFLAVVSEAKAFIEWVHAELKKLIPKSHTEQK